MNTVLFLTAPLALTGFSPATAQDFGNEWVSFAEEPSRLVVIGSVSDPETEVDFAWGDLNQDGWNDVVVVRKQPWSTAGKRKNMLLINVEGVLTDRTDQYATASDVLGDHGFLTATNDRDVVIVDVDQDGWSDVVTATNISVGDPKHVGHPRVYRNLGNDGSGNWLGLIHEDARIPQLYSAFSGAPTNPNFSSVCAGDVTGDGYPDLYFVDYDSSVTGTFDEDPSNDMNDRLLVNDGTGFFTDESQLRMSDLMLESDFGTHGEIEDINQDGTADIVKDIALVGYIVRASYNNPDNEGYFELTGDIHANDNPYFFNLGDLNKDRRADIAVSADEEDRYRYNLGNDALGRVVWGPPKVFDFLAGSDGGIAGDNMIVDLDNDGWRDIIITDVDLDVFGCGGRTYIYHNPGGVPGEQITLIEERKSPFDGWLGVEGMSQADLEGTHDVAVFDIDGDGAVDMLFGRCADTFVWINQGPDAHMTEYCIGAPNSAGAGGGGAVMDGTGSSSIARNDLALEVSGAPPDKSGLFYYGPNQAQIPFGDGFRCVDGAVFRLGPAVSTDGVGFAQKRIDYDSPPAPAGQIFPGSTWRFQLWYRDPMGPGGSGFNLSSAVAVSFAP